MRDLEAVDDGLPRNTGQSPRPSDHDRVAFDGNLDLARVDAGEGGHDADVAVGLVDVDRRLPAGLLRAGQARPEELALQSLRPFDQRTGFRPHVVSRIAIGRHELAPQSAASAPMRRMLDIACLVRRAALAGREGQGTASPGTGVNTPQRPASVPGE